MKKTALILFLFFIENTFAQKPFECGFAYLTVSDGSKTSIYKVVQNFDKTLSTLLFVVADADFNAAGFRRQDNFIYATSGQKNADNTWNFLRIGADGKSKTLKKMPFDTNYDYYAGDITVDGKYYVLLANGSSPNKLYLVDLEDPNYGFQELNFPAGTNFNSPDIAFSPDGTKLYAYNSASKKLLEIDYKTAKITKEYDNTSPITGNYSGMWSFDCAIFGYSRQYDGYLKSEIEGKENPVGFMTNVSSFKPSASSSIDGCSCPPPVKLFKIAKKVKNPDTCVTEIKFYFAIENKCGIRQNNITFKDELPKEFSITKIDKNPFGGNIVKGIGGNSILIENMTILDKNDTLVVTTRIKLTVEKDLYKNQAFLDNIKHQNGQAITIKSDDPTTPEYLDSTVIKAPLIVKFSKDTISLCPNGIAKAKPKAEGENLKFAWNTGEKTQEIVVKKAGIYIVTVTSDCDYKIDTQIVVNQPLMLELGEDKNILPGDSILLFPEIKSYNPIVKYNWIPTQGANLKYKDKPNNISKPNENEVSISLFLEDDQGCTTLDKMSIKMRRNLYVPNAFSPNDDGINDWFYVFTEAPAKVEILQIFDRWGNLIFENSGCNSNDPECGWNGMYKNKKAAATVYTYRARVVFLDGKIIPLSGDVTLVR